MKRILIFVLVVLMAFSISSCGKETAEKYCYNCGKGITKEYAYCPDCGTLVKNIGETTEESTAVTTTEAPTTTEKTTEPETTTATTVATTSTATKPAHSHAYSKKVTPATCTEKGFTTYTCACGKSYKDNYTEPSHNYKNNVCTRCDAVDRSYAYGILAECVKENGKKENDNIYYLPFAPKTTTSKFRIYYDAESDQLYTIFYSYDDDGEVETTFKLYLTLEGEFDYEYNFIDSFKMTGTVDGSTFKKGDPLKYDYYDGEEKNKDIAIKLASTGTAVTLEFLDMTSDLFELGLELKDFGFTAYVLQ